MGGDLPGYGARLVDHAGLRSELHRLGGCAGAGHPDASHRREDGSPSLRGGVQQLEGRVGQTRRRREGTGCSSADDTATRPSATMIELSALTKRYGTFTAV